MKPSFFRTLPGVCAALLAVIGTTPRFALASEESRADFNPREVCTSSTWKTKACLQLALQYRCTNYGRFFRNLSLIRACNLSVARMVTLLDLIQVAIGEDQKNVDDPVEKSGLLLKQVFFKRDLTRLFTSTKTEKIFAIALAELRDSVRFDRPHRLWESVLRESDGDRLAALTFMGEAMQDISEGRWHLAYLADKFSAEKLSDKSTPMKSLEAAAEFIELFELESGSHPTYSAYPALGNLERNLHPYLHHFYIPALLSTKLKAAGESDENAFFTAFLLNTGYEFTKIDAYVGNRRWPFRDPAPFNRLEQELELRKIYTGYIGALWGIGREKSAKPFSDFALELSSDPYRTMRELFLTKFTDERRK
ncbi:MAG: hypothetical protein H7301_15385 [Cryobacterium sp.]|nr:hypothetical protein [Oligoflexia bacterium]